MEVQLFGSNIWIEYLNHVVVLVGTPTSLL